jgi:hypothetical protein
LFTGSKIRNGHTGVTTKGALKVTGFKLPNFDRAVLGACGKCRILRMKSKSRNIRLMSLEFELGRCDGYVEIIGININGTFFDGSLWHFLKVLNLFLQVCDLFLKGENRLPF